MRIGLISDIHGNLPALEAVLADLRAHAPDLIVNLGDLVSGPLWPVETLQLLQTLDLPTVRGNHDRWLGEAAPQSRAGVMGLAYDALDAAQREALGQLPASLELPEGVLAVHGTPASDTEYLLLDPAGAALRLSSADEVARRLDGRPAGATLVLCGHSHYQHSAAVGATLVLNPGSVGFPRYAGSEDFRSAEASSPHARYALASRRADGWSLTLMALAYDFGSVAARAREHGARQWAESFLGS
jgi:predicted phosphodiesterase